MSAHVESLTPTDFNQIALACRSSFIQWTLFNCLLVLNLMMTHNGCAWTDKPGTLRQRLWFCGVCPGQHPNNQQQALAFSRLACSIDAAGRALTHPALHQPGLVFVAACVPKAAAW